MRLSEDNKKMQVLDRIEKNLAKAGFKIHFKSECAKSVVLVWTFVIWNPSTAINHYTKEVR